jgi:hypothetical protein
VEELKVVGNCLYGACGGAFPPSQPQGIYRHKIGTSPWTNLSSAAGIDTTTSYWRTLDGYHNSTSGTDTIIWSCDNPVKGQSTYRSLVETVVDSSGNLSSAAFLTDTGNVQLQYMPPDHRLWWHYGSNYQNWLGGSSYINGHVTIDPNNTSNLYVTADNGMYRSTDGGQTWTIASNGMPLFAARSVTVVPDTQNPGHIVFGDSDWCSWDVTDGIAYDASTTHTTPVPVASQEGFALAADPSGSTVFIAAADKYSAGDTNVNGDVYSRSPGGPPFTWTSTALGGHCDGQVPIGLAVTRDASANQYVLAAVTGSAANGAGMWQMVNGGGWTRMDQVIGTANQSTSYMPVAVLPGSPYVYVLDRGAGKIFRAANYGNNNGPWDTPWSFPSTNSDSRTGFLALNPAVANELWVANLQGLYKISGANSGQYNPSPINGVTSPGAIAFTPDGTVYCLELGSSGSPDTVLLRSVDGGNSWQNVSGPGPGVAANASRPQDMAIGPDRRIYIANGANIVTQGFPAAGWTAQGGDLHTGPDEHTGAATQVVASTAPVTATGAITSGNWLMIVVALET